VLRGSRHRELVAVADDRAFAPALTTAVQRLESQVARVRRSRRSPRDGDRTG
jgi:7,8-dihydro-6-hydroxymethylpterin-pyrophosphokinase